MRLVASAAVGLSLFVSSAAIGQDALALITQMEGAWTGTLTYRDYQSGDRSDVAMRADVSISPDGNRITREIRYAEPGDKRYFSEIITIPEDEQTLTIVSFANRNVSTSTYEIVSVTDLGGEGWQIVLLGEGVDAGEPADVRLTAVYAVDRLIQTKDVRPKDTDNDWAFRNEVVLDRFDLSNEQNLVGEWEIDLRPTPDAEPALAPLVIDDITNGRINGSFYGAPIEIGSVNTNWGAVRFAIVTRDGSGPYGTFGVLQPDGSISGTTLSTGRQFLTVWTGQRADLGDD